MVKRVYDAILHELKDELQDYKHLEKPTSYALNSTHGDIPYEEYAEYTVKKTGSKPTGSEMGIGEICNRIADEIKQERPEIEHVEISFSRTIVTIEVYNVYNGDE